MWGTLHIDYLAILWFSILAIRNKPHVRLDSIGVILIFSGKDLGSAEVYQLGMGRLWCQGFRNADGFLFRDV